jgi:hypothetical protein
MCPNDTRPQEPNNANKNDECGPENHPPEVFNALRLYACGVQGILIASRAAH